MFVITADQVDSRSSADRVTPMAAAINREFGASLVQRAERTVGDELQLTVTDGTTALAIVLALTRTGQWSVGVGAGTVLQPLGRSVRESTGAAFISARDAVERAKRRQTRFAISAEKDGAADVEALVDLLLLLRMRRTDKGWALYDRIRSGATQADAAAALGITPQAASKMARSAGLRAELAAADALGRLVSGLDDDEGGHR